VLQILIHVIPTRRGNPSLYSAVAINAVNADATAIMASNNVFNLVIAPLQFHRDNQA
jgi:hypothetical protein